MTVRDPRFYAAWQEEEHAVHFDGLRFIPTPLLVRRWEGFNEVHPLADLLRREPRATVLEVGCATREISRYVARRHPAATYIGADISEPAVARARQKFGTRTRFIMTDPSLAALDGLAPDVVFSRDVLQHQTEPWPFLERLYGLARRYLVMRIRTRDRGVTEYDAERSCQYHAGAWVPYIMLNVDELVETLATRFEPPPSRIELVKNPIVLGGHHWRFLPKDCYEPATGTAETAMLLVKGAPAPRDGLAWTCRRASTASRPRAGAGCSAPAAGARWPSGRSPDAGTPAARGGEGRGGRPCVLAAGGRGVIVIRNLVNLNTNVSVNASIYGSIHIGDDNHLAGSVDRPIRDRTTWRGSSPSRATSGSRPTRRSWAVPGSGAEP